MGEPAIRSMEVENGPFDPAEYRTLATYMWENAAEGTPDEINDPDAETRLYADVQFVRLNADGSVKEVLQECGYSNVPGEDEFFRNSFCVQYDPGDTVGGSCYPNDPDPCQMRATIPGDAEQVHYGIRVWLNEEDPATSGPQSPPAFDPPPGLHQDSVSFARSWTVDVNVDIEEPLVEEPPEDDQPEDVEGELADNIDVTACAINPPTGVNDEWSASWTIENDAAEAARVELEWTSMGEVVEDAVVEVAAGGSETGITDLGTTQELQSVVGVDAFDVSIRVAGAEAIQLA